MILLMLFASDWIFLLLMQILSLLPAAVSKEINYLKGREPWAHFTKDFRKFHTVCMKLF